ncbi:MAG: heme exporter protein CcmB [Longimicrobiaceae bacterium]
MTRLLADALVVAGKDLRLELRGRERLVAMSVFAVLTAVVFAFSLDPAVRSRTVAGAMLWVTLIFAGMLGLGRSFALEKEADALTGLLLSPLSPAALFLGKALANLILLLGVALVAVPVYFLFFGWAVSGSWPGLALVVILATTGFVALGTLFGAVAVHTRLGETLLPVLLLPLLIPVVIFAASATQRLLVGRPLAEVDGSLRLLLAFDLVTVVVCALLFRYVVEE